MGKILNKSKRLVRQVLGQELWMNEELRCEKLLLPGWCICPIGINEKSRILSLGVGNDIRFDTEMVKRFSCQVHAFDPTPKWITWIKTLELPSQFHFYPYAICNYDGSMKMFPRVPKKGKRSNTMLTLVNEGLEENEGIDVEVKKVATVLKELDIDRIDILKMDIEAAEYEVISDILQDKVSVYQIIVEFHHRFPFVSIKQTKDALLKLREAGYRIFHISEKAREYSFIHEKTYHQHTGGMRVEK